MQTTRWEPVMATGHVLIDDDHRLILGHLAGLEQLSSEHRLVSCGLDQYAAFVDFVGDHFGREEALMEPLRRDHVMAHRSEHDLFLDQLAHFSRLFGKGDAVLHDELLRFLRAWLIGHIMGSDHKLAHLLAHHGETVSSMRLSA